MQRFWLVLLGWLCAAGVVLATPKCLFVSSYHQGYPWSDGVQRGLELRLGSECLLRQFDMDTKRHKSPQAIASAVDAVLALIEEWRPDIVIAADDNAARYLIQPHFRDADLPFVFCGVNWSVEEYGFPYENVTGMVEVAPIVPMLEQAQRLTGSGDSFFYLGADTATEKKNLARFERAAQRMKLRIESHLASSTDDWLAGFARAQQFPYLVIGSSAGIDDWDADRAHQQVMKLGRVMSVTNHDWMMPYSVLGYTKVPEEQGDWAGEVALAILGGTRPADIPVVANRKWEQWINPELQKATGVHVPTAVMAKAKRVVSR